MDIYKKMTVWELLSFLKSRVKDNVDLINKNIADLREIKKNSISDKESQSQMNKVNSEISKLTVENNQFLSVFNDLLKLHNNHLATGDFTIQKEESTVLEFTAKFVAECIHKTISGEIPISENHPLLSQSEAYNSLLESLMNNELYEKCAELIQIKEGLNNSQ